MDEADALLRAQPGDTLGRLLAVFIWASVLTGLLAGSESLGGVWVLVGGTLILLAGAIIPWIREGVGSFIVLGEGLLILVLFTIVSNWRPNIFMFAASLPALVGGGLSLASWLVTRRAPPREA